MALTHDLLRPLLPPNPSLRSLRLDCARLEDDAIGCLARSSLHELLLLNCENISGRLLSKLGTTCRDLRYCILQSLYCPDDVPASPALAPAPARIIEATCATTNIMNESVCHLRLAYVKRNAPAALLALMASSVSFSTSIVLCDTMVLIAYFLTDAECCLSTLLVSVGGWW